MTTPIKTLVSCLTPRAAGGIATVGVRGPSAWHIVEPLFQSRSQRSATVLLGRLGDGQADDVVVVRSGDQVEIHCHGGVAVVKWIIDLLRRRGAVEVSWAEWLHQTHEPLRAEAEIALTQALTSRTASILLDQLHGAFAVAVQGLLAELRRGDQAAARAGLQALARWAPLGRHLTEPWRIVLAGAPNVGKSSLANAILGYQRSITSPLPGTTRDAVAALTALEGWPIEIIDTAGQRRNAVGLEAAGAERAKRAAARADLVLLVLDQSVPPQETPAVAAKALAVVNKIDLPAAWQPQGVRVSATTGEGLPELLRSLVLALMPNPPMPGQAVPFTQDLCLAIERAAKAFDLGKLERVESILEFVLDRPRPCPTLRT